MTETWQAEALRTPLRDGDEEIARAEITALLQNERDKIASHVATGARRQDALDGSQAELDAWLVDGTLASRHADRVALGDLGMVNASESQSRSAARERRQAVVRWLRAVGFIDEAGQAVGYPERRVLRAPIDGR
jgi:hypothetical protein